MKRSLLVVAITLCAILIIMVASLLDDRTRGARSARARVLVADLSHVEMLLKNGEQQGLDELCDRLDKSVSWDNWTTLAQRFVPEVGQRLPHEIAPWIRQRRSRLRFDASTRTFQTESTSTRQADRETGK